MATTEAKVEVLTAEVRALVVGSRQITLSVFRQLDWVKWEEIEPMGRVNDYRDNDPEVWYLVGRSRKDGSLVRAQIKEVYPPRELGKETHRDYEQSWMSANPREIRYPPTFGVPGYDEAFAAFNAETLKRGVLAKAYADEAVQRQAQRMENRYLTWITQQAIYDALPLIVLAGLK